MEFPHSSQFIDQHPLLTRIAIIGGSLALAAGLAACSHTSVNHHGAPPSAPSEVSPLQAEFAKTPSWELNFSKLPNGPVDSSQLAANLNPDVPGWNDEQQAYTDRPANIRIENGQLIIEARRENYTYPNDNQGRTFAWTSGRLETYDSNNGEQLPHGLTFTYGKVEADIMVPDAPGTWPAFWLLSANQPHANAYIAQQTQGLTPTQAKATADQLWSGRTYLKDGEIDVEWYGHHPNRVEATVHTFNTPPDGIMRGKDVAGTSYSFHRYAIEVTPTAVIWTIDGKIYDEYKKTSANPDEWPFQDDNQLYVILNLAMGGTGGGDIAGSAQTQQMRIKNLAFYEYTAN